MQPLLWQRVTFLVKTYIHRVTESVTESNYSHKESLTSLSNFTNKNGLQADYK